MSMVKLKKLNIEAYAMNEGSLQMKQDTYYSTTDFWINPQSVISITPVTVYNKQTVLAASKIETSNQIVLVLGSADEIHETLSSASQTLLKG